MKILSTIVLLYSLTTGLAPAALITFDDLPMPALGGSVVPNGYAGLIWRNMFYLNAANNNLGAVSGYRNGVVSRPNVAFMGDDSIGQFVQVSGPAFNFNSAWLTAAWNDGLNVRVRGYAPSSTKGVLGTLLYDRTVIVNTSGHTPFTFDYLGIGTLRFDVSGGVPGPVSGGGKNFVIDDMTITPPGTPIAFNQSLVLAADFGGQSIVLRGSDPDGDPLTYKVVSGPLNGLIAGTPPFLSYSGLRYLGPDSLTFVASDGVFTSPPATVSITVKKGLFLQSISVVEGNSGTKAATFTVTMTLPGSELDLVSVSYRTIDGTATAGSDYVATSGTLLFGENTTQTITVPVIGDQLVEPNETFLLQLFNPSANAVIVSGLGTARCTIVNDDFYQLVPIVPIPIGTAALAPENSSVAVGEPVNLSLSWTHPVGWRHLDSVDLLIVGDQGEILPVRWHAAENTFSLYQPAADRYTRTGEAGSPARFETSGATLSLQECTGGGPPGQTATIDLSLSFKPEAAGRTFSVEAFATDDAGNQQGFESVGTITVEPR